MKKVISKNQIAITSLAVLIAVAGYLNFTRSDIPTVSQGRTGEQYSSDTNAKGQSGPGSDKNLKGQSGSGTDKNAKVQSGSSIDKNAKVQSESGTDKNAKGQSGSDSKKTKKQSEEETGKETMKQGISLISEKVDDSLDVEDEETIGDAVLTQAQVGEYISGAKMEREQTHSKTKETLNQIIENERISEDARQEAAERMERLADIMEKEAAAEQLLNTKGYGDAVVSIGDDSVDVILNYDELEPSDRAQIEDIITRKTGYGVSQIVISRMKLSAYANR